MGKDPRRPRLTPRVSGPNRQSFFFTGQGEAKTASVGSASCLEGRFSLSIRRARREEKRRSFAGAALGLAGPTKNQKAKGLRFGQVSYHEPNVQALPTPRDEPSTRDRGQLRYDRRTFDDDGKKKRRTLLNGTSP